ncbi:MAG: hypothetical protein QHC67_06010 [Sphingobium sp.]|uniref:hypothetical protein n=1 Tax=Sphingobium sp. TaxID=1912891 RepID=UPI0029A76E0D|nr:hypothetical protein [Sphingobium sp.]MDX3909358.1 hypothetical protein [Sphingobium sp.]
MPREKPQGVAERAEAILIGAHGEQTVMVRSVLRVGIAGVCLFVALGGARGPVSSQVPRELAALEPGEWSLTDRDTGGVVRKICLGDKRQLLQLRHHHIQCSRFVVTDAERQVSVTNDCAAAGNERTDIRIETPRLIQLQSQGIERGAPFSMAIEGRRVRACQ